MKQDIIIMNNVRKEYYLSQLNIWFKIIQRNTIILKCVLKRNTINMKKY
jgi:hypothetical protein